MSLLAWLREIHGLDPIPYKKGGDYSPSGFVVAYPKNYKRGEPGEWKHVYTTSDTHLRYARPVKVVVEQSDPFIVDASFFDYELGFSVVDNGKEYAAWGEFVLTEVKLIEKAEMLLQEVGASLERMSVVQLYRFVRGLSKDKDPSNGSSNNLSIVIRKALIARFPRESETVRGKVIKHMQDLRAAENKSPHSKDSTAIGTFHHYKKGNFNTFSMMILEEVLQQRIVGRGKFIQSKVQYAIASRVK
jgi:hypothetical protein